MCGGNSSRISEGGAIAILRGRGNDIDELGDVPPFMAKVTLHNFQNIIATRATFQVDDLAQMPFQECCCLVIHQYGDLNSEDPDQMPLHHLPFEIGSIQHKCACEVFLPSRLDLGVGGNGVIGRKISLMQSKRVIAEGIIGWN